jgi:hypothetical protein
MHDHTRYVTAAKALLQCGGEAAFRRIGGTASGQQERSGQGRETATQFGRLKCWSTTLPVVSGLRFRLMLRPEFLLSLLSRPITDTPPDKAVDRA